MQADKTNFRRAVVNSAITQMSLARQRMGEVDIELQSALSIDRALNDLIELASNAESLRTMKRLDTSTMGRPTEVSAGLETEIQAVDQDIAYSKAEIIYAFADYARVAAACSPASVA